MDSIRTHSKIEQSLSGVPKALRENYAEVELHTTEIMASDEKGLVHGGFLFSAADYTAMLAVNHPNVVLAKAQVKFLSPVRVGEKVKFSGSVVHREGNKFSVKVEGMKGEVKVFYGEFLCVVTEKHVLER